MSRFAGKVVLVVGAAQGIGRCAAEMYAAEGATVITADVQESVHEARSALEAEHSSLEGFSARLDVTDAEQCGALAALVVAEHGHIDVLAHIAGVVQTASRAEDLPIAEWERVFAVNTRGPFFTTRAVIPYMRERGYGRVALIGSYYGRHGVALFTAYNASKAAVISYASSLALEVADAGITVNSVSPGMIDTEMHQDALVAAAAASDRSYEEVRDTEWAKTPLGRAGEPADIANAVLFLTSDQAPYITGASLDVNGGVLTR
jgi:NAD(P)-dependent dehydrogenase (short-subunit alcohol dehydrogenase family)